MFGTPEAVSAVEPPKDLVDRFKRVDEHLDLKFVQFPVRDGANMNSIKHWAIILKWQQDDKRRLLIQRGDLPENGDFDVLRYLPLNCSVDDAFAFLEQTAVSRQKERGDVGLIISRLHKFNDDVKEAALKDTMDLANELVETNAKTAFKAEGKAIPKIIQSGKALPADMTKKEK